MKTINLLLAGIMAATVISCDKPQQEGADNKEPEKPAVVDGTVSLSATAVEFDSNEAGSRTITLTANMEWEVLKQEEIINWLTIDPMSGGKTENTVITLNVTENKGVERNQDITFATKDGKSKKTLKISQAEQPVGSLGVDVAEINLTAEDENATINVSGTVNWTAEVTEGGDFVSISSGTSGKGEGTVRLAVTKNDTSYERKAKVVVSTEDRADNSSRTIIITQAAAELAPEELVIEFDFTGLPCADFPTASGTSTVTTYTINGHELTFKGTHYYSEADACLWLKSSGTYVAFPAIEGKKLVSVTVSTNKNCASTVKMAVRKTGEGTNLGSVQSLGASKEVVFNIDAVVNTSYCITNTGSASPKIDKLTVKYE